MRQLPLVKLIWIRYSKKWEDTADATKKASTAAKGFSEGLTALEQKASFLF